jgi:uncharacterized protein (TIGR03086 family)
MEAKELFRRGLDESTAVVERVRPEDFALPTPCTEWDVRALLGHMLYELSWVPEMVSGKTIAEVGSRYDGDLIGADPVASWRAAASAARAAVERCDPAGAAHLSYADVPNEAYLREVGGEQLTHAWDLGEAIGQAVHFPPDLTRSVYEDVQPKAEGLSQSGLFAPPVAVPDSADLQTKLIALMGRAPDWRERD